MIKKLTRNLLSTILTVLLVVGVFGIAAPKEVHAASAYTYSLLLTCKDGGANFKGIKIGSTFHNANWGGVNVSLQVDAMPSTFVITVNKKDCTMNSSDMNTNGVKKDITACKVPFEVTGSLTPNHTHTWNNNSYSASGNVITATCQGSGTCSLTKPTLTLNASGKTYDGSVVTATTTPNGTWSSQGLPTPTISYSPANSKNVGTYTASVKVGNATATQSFTISPKEIGLTWGTSTFTYDGDEHAPTASISGVVSGDTCNVSVDGAQTIAGNHTATAASLSNSNYKLPASNTKQFTINKKAINLTGLTAEGRDYNGSKVATLDRTSEALDGVIDGDDVSIGEVTGTFDNKNASVEDKPVTATATLTGDDAGNYTLNPITGLKAKIHHLATKVSGITASDKTYDGTVTATVDTSKAEFKNMVPGDNLSISATGAFEDANVGEGKTVNLTLGELTGDDKDNYILDLVDSQSTAKASITGKPMQVSAEGYEKEYDEAAHSITVTVTDPADGYTITYKGPEDSEYKDDNPSFTDPGTYEVAYKVTAPNYAEFTGTATVKIKGQDFEGVLGMPYSGVYDGIEHGIGVVVEPLGLEGYTITYSESEIGPYGDEIKYKDFTNGEKTVYFKVSMKGYNDFKGSSTVNITQKEIGLQWGDTAFVYDGQKHVPTATATGLVEPDECKVTVTGEQINANANSEFDFYTAEATALSNNNYKLPENKSTAFTIAQKEVTLNWGETALTYNGQDQHPEVTVEGLIGQETCELTVDGAKKDTNKKSGIDKYTATVTELKNKNYKFSQTAETEKEFTIIPKEITVDGITHKGKIYDSTTNATADLYYEDEHLVGKVDDDDLELEVTGTFDTPDVGTDKTITLSDFKLTGNDKDNYVLAATGQQETTKGNISTKYLTITAHDKEKFYGGVDPEFTYDAQGLIVGDEITGSLSRKPGENVGGHTITLGTLHAGGNYAIDYTHGTLTIKKATENNVTANITGWTYGDPANSPGATGKFGADTATFTYSDSADGEYSSDVPTQAGTYYVKATVEGTDNYPGAVSKPVEFEISPKEIGLQWGKTAFTYTGEAQKPTATATNLVVGDECEVTVDGAQKDSNAKTKTENYTATASITNPNYKLPQDPTTTFTIAQKEVTVSGITTSNKVYDGNNTATVDTSNATLTGKVETDALTVSTTGTFSDKNVGTGKTVTFTDLILGGADAGNYTVKDDSQTSTEADITAKPVIVTADEITKYYGQDDPELTYKVDPELIEGDKFSGALQREQGEDVGDYDIEEGTLSAGKNYDIDYTPNTFVILQADNSVTASIEGWTYGDKANEPSATADFGLETVKYTYSDTKDGDYSEDVPTQAGTYYLKASIAETNNYKGATSVPVEFTIDQKEVELEWSDTDLTYNGKAQKPKATVKADDLVGDDTCDVTVEGAQTDSNIKSKTDSYTAEATKLSNDNYKLPEEDEKKTTEFTIAPKELTSDMLSVDPESIKNDGTKKGPKITLKDEEVGELTDEDYDLSGETESDKSGTHFFEVKGKGNYTGTLSSSWVMYENRQNHDRQKGTDGKGDIEIFVDVIGNTENITVDNFTIDFAKKLLSEEDLERYNNGENVLIYVELKEESKDDVTTKDKELILSEFNKVAAKDIRWFDITVWKRIGNDKATQIHDTVDNLEMTISVPDEYKNAPADNTRTFYLARSHNGEADILTKTNEKKVGLSSNKFSIYALAYKDTYHGSKYIVPKTGD